MANKKDEELIGEVKLKNVRLSFAALFKPERGPNKDDGSPGDLRYKANFLIPKDTDDAQAVANMKALKRAKGDALKKTFGDDIPKIKADRLCTRDGDLEDWDGYADNWYVSSSNKKPIPVVGRDRSPVEEGDKQAPYSGCYVNAIVRLYAMNKEGIPRRVNASLEAVQFYRKGDAFGAAPVDPNEKFDDFSDEDDDLDEMGDEDDGGVL